MEERRGRGGEETPWPSRSCVKRFNGIRSCVRWSNGGRFKSLEAAKGRFHQRSTKWDNRAENLRPAECKLRIDVTRNKNLCSQIFQNTRTRDTESCQSLDVLLIRTTFAMPAPEQRWPCSWRLAGFSSSSKCFKSLQTIFVNSPCPRVKAPIVHLKTRNLWPKFDCSPLPFLLLPYLYWGPK